MDTQTTSKHPRTWLQSVVYAFLVVSGFAGYCNNASAEEVVQLTAAGQPACAAGLRLRAVQYDPNHEDRSFATFAGSPQRAQPLRRGARVSGFAIERIEQGAVVLSSPSQRCTIRLRGAAVERELRAISVDDVRSAMRTRSARTHTIVSGLSVGVAIKTGS